MFEFEYVQKLNDLERDVYNYVIKNPDTVLTMKIRELAQEVHVSTTTILRFCKKMNCNGYTEFMFKYRNYLEKPKTIVRDDDNRLMEFFKKAQSEEIQQRLKDIVSITKHSNKVIFLGIGSSGIMAKYGAKYLSSVGKIAQYIDDPYYCVPAGYYEGSIIIVLSVSGETEGTIKQLERFQNFNCAVIAITNTETSTIAKMADITLAYYFPLDMLEYNVNITTQIPTAYYLERIGKGVQKELANVELE